MDDMTRQSGLQALWDSSQLSGENAAYLEGLYEAYLQESCQRIRGMEAIF